MYSGTEKKTFMGFNTFKGIIDNCNGEFELQLEGGEPFTHKAIYLFIEYAINTGRCKKVIILTNGLKVWENMLRIIPLINWYKIDFEIKISINYFLLENTKVSIPNLAKFAFSTQFIRHLQIVFNVRKRIGFDEEIKDELEKYGLLEISNIYYFQAYGKLSKSEMYAGPSIVQNIDNWILFASDGTEFGQDLIARSEFERILP